MKLIVFEYDGVFTNSDILFDSNGEIIKNYNIKDEEAIKLLKENGFIVGVISKFKENKYQRDILENLHFDKISMGNNNKYEILKNWCIELDILLEEVALMVYYINNPKIIKDTKIIGFPKNGYTDCLKYGTFISSKNGGNGCVKEFCEYIIKIHHTQKNINFKNGKITALIAVRKNSVRIPNKNIKPFGDTNLLTLKLKILKNIEEIDEIIVTSNCELALKIAKLLKVTYIKRDEYYCSDKCSGSEMLEHIASQCTTEHILYSPVTSPFISINHIKNAIKIYKNLNTKYDCVITKSKIKEFIWDDNKPINYTVSDFPRSQDLTDNIFYINFGCCILPRKIMIQRKYIIGYNPLFINNYQENNFTDIDIDIDTPLDFETANLLYNKYFKKKSNINLIDVTIRDGGFTNNWNWTYEEVVNLYKLSSNLGYTYFELGYFINEELKEKGSGIWRNLPFNILENFPLDTCKISVMIDHWKYDLSKLPEQKITKIDLIRVTSYKENITKAIQYCNTIKKLGYKVSLNLIVASWFNNEDINNILKTILSQDLHLDYIFIADSYGNLDPKESNEIINKFISYLNFLDIPIGFHIHDTAGLGLANAINLIDNISYLDTSFFGLGKGVGNLSNNKLLLYLKFKKQKNINVDYLFKYIDKHCTLEQILKIKTIMLGFMNIHPDSFKKVEKPSILETYNNLLLLSDKEKYHYSNFTSTQ